MERKKYFRRSHHEKSANNHRRFDGAFMNQRVAVRSSNRNSLPQNETHPQPAGN
jgi:hypothetical protein